jgi:hypothetical protein
LKQSVAERGDADDFDIAETLQRRPAVPAAPRRLGSRAAEEPGAPLGSAARPTLPVFVLLAPMFLHSAAKVQSDPPPHDILFQDPFPTSLLSSVVRARFHAAGRHTFRPAPVDHSSLDSGTEPR